MKRPILYGFFIQIKYYIYLILIILSQSVTAQTVHQIRTIDSLFYAQKLDSLKQEGFLPNPIDSAYELAVFVALSYYPELKNTQIEFKEQKLRTTCNARPTIGSTLFRKRAHRKYIIRINNSLYDSVIQLKNAPLNAQIGLFGHELAHIKDYESRNFFKMIGLLFARFSQKKLANFEKEIDRMTITNGLGWQLFDWSDFVLNKSCASKKYKKFKQAIYLQPYEIKNLMDSH